MRKKRCYTLLTLIWAVVIAVLSLVSLSQTAIKSPLVGHFDKAVHFVLYFVMTFLLMCSFKEETRGFDMFYKRGIMTFIIAFFMGIFIEFLQGNITKTRSFDVKDVYANAFGTVVAMLLVKVKKL